MELSSVESMLYGDGISSDIILVNAGWARHAVAAVPVWYWAQNARESGLFFLCWKG